MTAYYNEHDERTAAWLRELINQGHVAPGIVDTRSIEDVRPDELREFTQCHFFAGIGVWSYALRMAGWPDDRPVWTGSCPCQPFSTAGKGDGFADERHLWPAWFHLIEHAKPREVPIFGEQVASKDGEAWFDLVQADLEGAGYAGWPFDLCSAGFGSPNIRQRFYFAAKWMGDASTTGLSAREREAVLGAWRKIQGGAIIEPGCTSDRVANAGSQGPQEQRGRFREHEQAREPGSTSSGATDGMADADGDGRDPRGGIERGQEKSRSENGHDDERRDSDDRMVDAERDRPYQAYGFETEPSSDRKKGRILVRGGGRVRTEEPAAGPTNGFWRNADWLFCRDGKWRPVEPGTSPLATGVAERVGLLRGYGNGLNAEVAKGFIETCMEIL